MARGNTPCDQKKARAEDGLVLFEDEASFQLDPTLHRTWARRGAQPRIPTRGERKTAHVYGAIAVADARFTYAFADVFNGRTFLTFLKLLVQRYEGRKIFLIIDNGPCHNLNAEGKAWLERNAPYRLAQPVAALLARAQRHRRSLESNTTRGDA